MIDTALLRDFAENEQERDRLKAELEACEDLKKILTEKIVAMFGEDGVKSQNILMRDGSARTVHLRREIWAGHQGDAQALCDALEESGYESYVKKTFNTQSLSSLVKDLAKTYYGKTDLDEFGVAEILEAVPEDVRKVMKLSELFKIGCRGS